MEIFKKSLAVILTLCMLLPALTACDSKYETLDASSNGTIATHSTNSEHTCTFNQKIPSDNFKKSDGVYYYSCICGNIEEETFTVGVPHEHTFEKKWTITAEYHYHAPTCGHLGETSFYGKHSFSDNKCICGLIKGSDGLEYSLSSDGTFYTVSKGTAYSANIIIPNYYNGLPVTAIPDYAFRDYTGLKSVTISKNIISIGDKAFYDCGKVNVYLNETLIKVFNTTDGSNNEEGWGVVIKPTN